MQIGLPHPMDPIEHGLSLADHLRQWGRDVQITMLLPVGGDYAVEHYRGGEWVVRRGERIVRFGAGAAVTH